MWPAVSSLPLIFLVSRWTPCGCWDFQDVVPQDAPVVSVAVWESKAFLAVPRAWRDPRDPQDPPGPPGAAAGTVFLHDGPTLLEAPWPEEASNTSSSASRVARIRRPQAPRAFPRTEEQVLGDCSCLQSVTAVSVESGRGAARLWALDSGELPSHSRCDPKVVVFNLRGSNQKVLSRSLDGVPSSGLSGLALDSYRGSSGSSGADTRAYIGYPGAPGGGSIIVVSWKSRAFWQLRVSGMEAATVPTKQPALLSSRTAQHWDLALLRSNKTRSNRRPRMVVTPRESDIIFDVSLDALRGPQPDAKLRNDALVASAELGARRLARKSGPGPSCGLLGDPEGGLLYFLVQGSRLVRWDPRRGAGCRGHAVLLQGNASLPLTEALFLDGDGNAWAACTTFSDHSTSRHARRGRVHRDGLQDEQQEEHRVEHPDEHLYDEHPGEHRGWLSGRYRGQQHLTSTSWPPTRQRPRAAPSTRLFGEPGDDLDYVSEDLSTEPQEFVCMAPTPTRTPLPQIPTLTPLRTPPRIPLMRGSRVGQPTRSSHDPKTLMVTRREERTRQSDASRHRSMLISAEEAAVPAPRLHCVPLHWDPLPRDSDSTTEGPRCCRAKTE